MTLMFNPAVTDLIVRERDILTRIAAGGPLEDVLRDLVLLVEQPAGGEMLASVLFVSPDGQHLLEGAAPSLPGEYNAAIHGIAIGPGIGSCGTAAYCGEPVIVTDIAVDPLWKDFKDLALKFGLRACWSMPIKAADGAVLGTYANYYHEPRQPTDRDMEVISMVARTTGIAIERHRNDLARKRAEEARTLLLGELNHRVKNVFVLASSIVSLSVRGAKDAQDLAKTVQARLDALGRAHDLILPNGQDTGAGEPSSTFDQLLRHILKPYDDCLGNPPFSVSGPEFLLDSEAITGAALFLHELLTNAVKYGCLRDRGGMLSISWTVEGGNLHLRWDERGLECAGASVKRGFGSDLIQGTVERQFHGTIAYDWQPNGLSVAIDIPFSAIAAKRPGGSEPGEAPEPREIGLLQNLPSGQTPGH